MRWQNIDKSFRCYNLEIKLRTTPTTEQLIDNLMEVGRMTQPKKSWRKKK